MTDQTGATAPITFADPAVQQCPFESYDKLREEEPVYRDPVTGNYILTRYEDIRKALLNTRALRNRTGLTGTRSNEGANRIYAEKGWMPIDTLVSNDAPEHRLYRTLVDKVFTPPRVASLEPRIEEIVAELIDAMAATRDAQGEVDFLDAFAIRLPMYVIAEQLGVPRADMDRFKLWSDVSVESVNPMLTPEREVEIAEITTEMQHYLAAEIERVRAVPNETLISHLANTETQGRLLDVRELLSIIHQLLVAGNETTTTTLASGMLWFTEQPDLAETIHAAPARAKQFAEEVLRTRSPIQLMFRRVAEPVEIGGAEIPEGALVEVRFGAANRDPAQYACAHAVDLDRANASSHLAFGAGPHLCIGNQLARGELRIAFQALTRHFAGFRQSRGDASVEWMTSYIAHGPSRLWIDFERR
ncbi:cytochrome P450 [Rhizorhabdus argentea]|uniref:cytochrome P450 n=1 Tax=Rhizorhabdus argentea TaxID=1387174 RepID=UPI0030EE9761